MESLYPVIRADKILVGPREHVVFLREQNHLPILAQLVQDREDGNLSLGVALHEHIVENQRRDLVRIGELIGQGDSQQEIDLFGCSVREVRRVSPLTGWVEDVDFQRIGKDADIGVAPIRDRWQRLLHGVGEARGHVPMHLVLGLLEELLGLVEDSGETCDPLELGLGSVKIFFCFDHALKGRGALLGPPFGEVRRGFCALEVLAKGFQRPGGVLRWAFGLCGDVAELCGQGVRLDLPALRAGDPPLTDALLKSGKPVLVNFFASWCAPCLAEHPLFTRLGEREGAVIIGIAWKNKRDEAEAWLKRLGDPFKSAGLDLDGKTGLDWGLSGVPETYAIDGQGIVRLHFRGPITERDLNESILPFLKGAK